jgi:glycopeptide antibiotics resistance protein
MEQREITIKRPLTVVLLLVSTLCIGAVTVWTSGKSYSKVHPIPFEDVRQLAERDRPVSANILAVIVVPIIVNVLMFMPWGFFMFISLYSVNRPTAQTYLLTVLLGLSLTLAIEAYQYFLPSRVADINDVIWNSCGAFVGALLGHGRLRVRFEFD